MSVSASIKITQIEPLPSSAGVRQFLAMYSSSSVRSFLGVSGSILQRHLWAISSPQATGPGGWPTVSKSYWSDTAAKQPYLLYRYRFGAGRSKKELFPTPAGGALTLYSTGNEWGALTSNHALLMYNRVFALSSSTSVRSFKFSGSGRVQDFSTAVSYCGHVQNFVGMSGDTTIAEYPFLLYAEPEPYSEKNPVDTDVFVRVSNYAYPISSGTITLYLDEEIQTGLQIDEFSGGLGGFNITWPNVDRFEYGAQVDVKWSFYDSAVPANRFTIRYPFYTVEDLAGPRVLSLTPAHGSVDIPILGPLQFTLEDLENDVDISTLVIYVNDVLISNGVGGTVEITRLSNEKGYVVVVTPTEPWLYGDLIPVAIFVSDTSANANETFFSYSFTTLESTAPRLLNIEPPPCTIAAPVGTDISVDVIDGGHGFDVDTIVVTVEEKEVGSEIQLIPIVHRDD